MPATDQDIREAAENLLQSSQQHQYVQSPVLDICKNYFFNTVRLVNTSKTILKNKLEITSFPAQHLLLKFALLLIIWLHL